MNDAGIIVKAITSSIRDNNIYKVTVLEYILYSDFKCLIRLMPDSNFHQACIKQL